MATIVALAVCVDRLLPGTRDNVWSSAGYVFLTANSVDEAMHYFKAGDFDLVLLGPSIPVEARERLALLIRSTGSRVPVVSIAGSLGHHDSFSDATVERNSTELLTEIHELLKKNAHAQRAAF